MRKIILIFILVTTFFASSQSIESQTPCASDALLENLIKIYPEINAYGYSI